jgi:hypothetical protein
LQFFGEIAIRFIAGKSENKRRASHDKQIIKGRGNPAFYIIKIFNKISMSYLPIYQLFKLFIMLIVIMSF